MEGACSFPMVAIIVNPLQLVTEAYRLCNLLIKRFGFTFSGDPDLPNIEATYNPGDGYAVIIVTNIIDSQMKKRKKGFKKEKL